MGDKRVPSTGILFLRIVLIPLTYLQEKTHVKWWLSSSTILMFTQKKYLKVTRIGRRRFQELPKEHASLQPFQHQILFPNLVPVLSVILLSLLSTHPALLHIFKTRVEILQLKIRQYKTQFTCTSDISTLSANKGSIPFAIFSANSPDCQQKENRLDYHSIRS